MNNKQSTRGKFHNLTNILIVEDSKSQREILARALSLVGYNVVEADSGEQALAIDLSVIDFIILDDQLPIMDGLSVAKIINTNLGIPYLVLTGKNDANRCKEYMRCGAASYLVKPFNTESIALTVEATFNSARNLKNVRSSLEESKVIARAEGAYSIFNKISTDKAREVIRSRARSSEISVLNLSIKIYSEIQKSVGVSSE